MQFSIQRFQKMMIFCAVSLSFRSSLSHLLSTQAHFTRFLLLASRVSNPTMLV
jgi:hypothetical protein